MYSRNNIESRCEMTCMFLILFTNLFFDIGETDLWKRIMELTTLSFMHHRQQTV